MIRRLVFGLDIDSDYTRLAFATFADNVNHGFDLLKYQANKRQLLEALDFPFKMQGKTNIRDAISHVRSDIFLQVISSVLYIF